jgi:hypothetical protein
VPGPRATAEASYVTNGVAVFMDSDPAPQVPSRPGPTSLQARMTRAIENTCGSAAREVEVIVRSNNSLLVRFKVHSATEGERLSQQVLQMPELGPYQVNLEVKVSP